MVLCPGPGPGGNKNYEEGWVCAWGRTSNSEDSCASFCYRGSSGTCRPSCSGAGGGGVVGVSIREERGRRREMARL